MAEQILTKFFAFVIFIYAAWASPFSDGRAFDEALSKRGSEGYQVSPLDIDLGHAVYKGVSNDTLGLNIWKGYVVYLEYLRKVPE